MRYGDIAPQFRERFVAGAFGPDIAAPSLNLQHDPDVVLLPAGGYVLNDTERSLEVRAELSEGSAALQLVQRKALTGFSIEFRPELERREAGVRVIEKATLTGLALCDKGAYPLSKAEVRAARALQRIWL